LPWRHQRCFQLSQWRRLHSSAHFCGSSAASSSRPTRSTATRSATARRYAVVGVRGSKELPWRVWSLCSSDRCSWVRGAGAAAHKVESRVRHFAGVAISPYKMAASTSTQQPQAGPRAAVPGQRLLFASDDFFIKGIVAAPRTQLSFAPTRSLTDEMLRGRRMMRWWRLASVSAGASAGAASASTTYGAAVAPAGGSQQW
jgi:hypothetical protein